jgi:hypothetical protein
MYGGLFFGNNDIFANQISFGVVKIFRKSSKYSITYFEGGMFEKHQGLRYTIALVSVHHNIREVYFFHAGDIYT